MKPDCGVFGKLQQLSVSGVSGEGSERANSKRWGDGAEEIYLVQLIVKYTEEFPCHNKGGLCILNQWGA